MPTLCKFVENYALLSGSERAQTGLWFFSSSGAAAGTLASVLTPLQSTRWTTQKTLHPTNLSLLPSRLYTVDINTGHVIASEDISAPALAAGTGGADSLPPECAHVLTLRGAPNTRRTRGRIYLPAMIPTTMTSVGAVNPTTRTTMVNAWAGFFTGVKNDPSDWTPVVYSRIDIAAIPITRIDMGDIIDVQRSRRRSLTESRTSSTI